MSTETKESQTYTGGCHCKANCYEVTLSPPLDKGNSVVSCNCSICSTNGYLLAFADKDDLKWTTGGEDKLTTYNFNTGKLTHRFCPTCGTSVLVSGTMGGVFKTGINTRTMDDVDVEKLHLFKYDGKTS